MDTLDQDLRDYYRFLDQPIPQDEIDYRAAKAVQALDNRLAEVGTFCADLVEVCGDVATIELYHDETGYSTQIQRHYEEI